MIAQITLSFLVAAIYDCDANKDKQIDSRYKLIPFAVKKPTEQFRIGPDDLYIPEEELMAFNLLVR